MQAYGLNVLSHEGATEANWGNSPITTATIAKPMPLALTPEEESMALGFYDRFNELPEHIDLGGLVFSLNNKRYAPLANDSGQFAVYEQPLGSEGLGLFGAIQKIDFDKKSGLKVTYLTRKGETSPEDVDPTSALPELLRTRLLMLLYKQTLQD